MPVILHIDFNSYFASVEQQANPRLRGKPVGVTGGDRLERTVLSTASIEAKKLGVKTGMPLWKAKKICPELIIVQGDSDKYLECSKRFWNILKSYSPYIEIFSIDEVFLELHHETHRLVSLARDDNFALFDKAAKIALDIKTCLRREIGEVVTCSIGISYNKLMAKLAGSLKKPDGLVIIPDQTAALQVLGNVKLDEICGIGPRIKKRLFNLGINSFKKLREAPKECLVASFKSYGEILYNMARGLDNNSVRPFFEKDEVKSIGHRHTIDCDTDDLLEIKQIVLKICEMVARRARDKNLVGKTVHFWYRTSFPYFNDKGMQQSLGHFINDGLEIFKIAWQIFQNIWNGEKIRMVGISISNLKSAKPTNLSWLPEDKKREIITQAVDKVNHKFGDFTVKRAIILGTKSVNRKPNPFLSDRRFKL